MNNNQLYSYLLRLADSSLIIGHRLSEWCGHGPILEEDIAMTNIALDHIGTATSFYEYAAAIENKGRSADDLAYLRDARDFHNNLLVEQPNNNDFGVTMLRQFFFSAFAYYLYEALQQSKDETIAGIAAKAVKESTYHLRHSRQWVLRLGDGTAESRQKMLDALTDLWKLTHDMFEMDEVDKALIQQGVAIDLTTIYPQWLTLVNQTLAEATLPVPEKGWQQLGGYKGLHSEHLGYLLAEMQSIPRAYPGAKW